MFIAAASYLSLLQSVADRCSLPYVSLVSELVEDGHPIYGIEVEIPAAHSAPYARSIFSGRLVVLLPVLGMSRRPSRLFLSCRVYMDLSL